MGSHPEVHVISDSNEDVAPEMNLVNITVNPFNHRPSVGSTRSLPTRGLLCSPFVSSGRLPVHPASWRPRSIIELIKRTAGRMGSRSEILSIDFGNIEHVEVKYLPASYDGDKIFELPPLLENIPTTFSGDMDGMEKQYDDHTWCKTMTTNVKNDYGLKFWKSACTGHLQCPNGNCDYIDRNLGKVNSTEWAGLTLNQIPVGGEHLPNSTLVCKVCHTPPVCVELCSAKIFHVTSRNPDVICAAIHLGSHRHPVSDGTCQETLDRMYKCIGEQVLRTPNAKNSAKLLGASKIFLADYLIRAIPGQGHLRGTPMAEAMDKFETMSDSNIRHFVAGTKKFLHEDSGLIDNIIRLKEYNAFKFVHESCFPGQTKEKVFVFKMLVDMPDSRTDLVKRMQPGRDLQDSWIMFDHVKRVKG